jgi:hypothetical protein
MRVRRANWVAHKRLTSKAKAVPKDEESQAIAPSNSTQAEQRQGFAIFFVRRSGREQAHDGV